MAVPSNWKRMSFSRRLDELANHFYSDSGAGTKGSNVAYVDEYVCGPLHKTVLNFVANTVTITDESGTCQYGGLGKIYDFPAGLILTLGAVIDGSITLGTTGTITDNWSGGIALGTAACSTGASLASTEADIMPQVTISAATSKVASVDAVSVATALTESGARWFDGTATAKDMYLNMFVTDEETHTSGTGTFTGTVTVHWINLGDK